MSNIRVLVLFQTQEEIIIIFEHVGKLKFLSKSSVDYMTYVNRLVIRI